MDTPIEEQQSFRRVTCNIAASEHEITEPNALSIDFINHVSLATKTLKEKKSDWSLILLKLKVAIEVSRLEGIKASKLKELILKKMASLDELQRGAHLVAASDNNTQSTIEAIETGINLLSCIDLVFD